MDYSNLIDIASFHFAKRCTPSAWLGHMPFAAWIMKEKTPNVLVELGTHFGNSYFAFCDAVAAFEMQTKCYAVDTWEGDQHAGNYGESVFAEVDGYNQEKYKRFSSLLRMRFDDAVSYFSDRSIDLLHIDGLHTYDAVRHDFETWLPKLAPGAVVMFHDTNVRERDFGVWRFWEEIQARYPNNLEFVHSFGLGVLQLGNATDGKIMEWLHENYNDKKRLISYFAALGAHEVERFNLDEYKNDIATLNHSVTDRDEQIASLTQEVSEREDVLQSIYGSSSWRITAPFRRIVSAFSRGGLATDRGK